MSANNWTACPRCKFRADKQAAQLMSEAEESYGKISAAEYLSAVNKAATLRDMPLDSTFREDWQIYGAEDASVVIQYRGSCGVCGLSCSIDLDKPIEGAQE